MQCTLGADAMVVEVDETAIGAQTWAKAEVEAGAEADKHMEIVFPRQIAEIK